MILGIVYGNLFSTPSIKVLIPIALFLMLFPELLDVKIDTMKNIIIKPKLLSLGLFFNFIISPLLIFGISELLLSGYPELRTGVILYALIPCGGLVPAFTGLLKGNINLAVTIMVASLLLSVMIVPIWLKVLMGQIIAVPILLIIKYLITIIVIPLLLAVLTRHFFIKSKGVNKYNELRIKLKELAAYGPVMMSFIIFSLNAKKVIHHPEIILIIMLPVFFFLLVLLLSSTFLGKLMKSHYGDEIALTISTTAKNNAIAVTIATAVFSSEAALVMAITGSFVQLPLMVIYLKLYPYVNHKLRSSRSPSQL